MAGTHPEIELIGHLRDELASPATASARTAASELARALPRPPADDEPATVLDASRIAPSPRRSSSRSPCTSSCR